ncbi:uncharacterized protein LOC132557496 [Ylistrum balloti]|uniref:uncharacterized protein LOC132557496 n=1 Tax=Ylistrum balloti TaxID=509963 RepID=UPI002905C557|nr:uncharacterized protein LOC132557496 [Ylistrum balloti]
MDTIQENTLRRNQVRFVDDLDPKDVLDALVDDGILTENDYEHVNTGKSRKERCRVLLAMLPTRGPMAYGSFQRALEKSTYPHLVELLHLDMSFDVDKYDLTGDSCVDKDTLLLKQISACSKCESLFPSEFSDPELSTLLKRNCCLLLSNVEPCDILDWHYQEFVLDRDECDRIRSEKTRKERFVAFLEEISKCKSGNVSTVFKMSLQMKYGFIIEQMDSISEASLNDVDSTMATTYNNSVYDSSVHEVTNSAKRNRDDCLPYSNEETTLYKTDGSGEDVTTMSCSTDVSFDLEHLSISQADSSSLAKPQIKHLSKSNLQRNKRRTIQQQHSTDSEEDVYCEEVYQKQRRSSKRQGWGVRQNTHGSSRAAKEYTLSISPGSLHPASLPNKHLEVAFNLLSTMINQGQYDKFEQFSIGIKHKYHHNADMMCILGYLHASKDLFNTKFDSAKRHITSAMDLVPKTSNPKYFTLELFTALTRMYITQKKIQKLQRTLDDAKMIIEADPVGCTGRAAGWLYMNDARNKTAVIGMLNVHSSNFINSYRNLHAQAKRSFQLSLVNFERDGGKDGPFGFGYALCRLTILLLQCGDSGLTMDVLHPDSDDIELAGGYLRKLEDSNIPIPKILEVHYLLAKCDYQYRRGNTVRALEYAEASHRLATEINMLEFTEHAHNRVVFLKMKTPIVFETLDEEEASRILFDETTNSSHGE